MIRREELLRVRVAVRTPAEGERDVFLLRQAAVPLPEIAARLRRPLGTAKTQLRSALHKLRRDLGAT